MVDPGQMFDRFRVEGVLAEGGMGRVYRAFDTRLHRLVALKLLLLPEASRGAGRDAAVAAVLHEARAVAALQHPNIVVVHEAGEHEGQPYLVMELVAGRSLRDRLREGPPWRECLGWLVGLARALAFAHRAGVLHRDVKPENVVVDEHGAVKVIDFGIARLGPSDAASAVTLPAGEVSLETLSKDGAIVGTPQYMAPEQLRGEAVDARCDQFAWGTVAYELFAGVRPWGGDGVLGVVSQILSVDPAPLEARCPELPLELVEVVARTLRKDPAERFGSMDAILTALEPLFQGRPSLGEAATERVSRSIVPRQGGGPGAGHGAEPRGGRRLPLLALSGVVVLVAIASGLGAWWQASGASSPRRSHEGVEVASSGRPANPGTAVTDLELPQTSSAQALAAYEAGRQAWRDGSPDVAADRFRAATEADPQFATAHLRLGLALTWIGTEHGQEISAARTQAELLRARLGDRDAALLATQRCGTDASCLRKGEELLARFPRDAELALLQAARVSVLGDPALAVALSERAVELDPAFALGWGKLAEDRSYSGDLAGASRALERCLSLSPRATSCHRGRLRTADQQGDCAAYLESARTLREIDPGHSGARAFANGLAATGASRAAVLEALQQAWGRMPEGERGARSERDRAALELLEGDLESGAARLGVVQAEVAAWEDPWRWLHVTAVLLEALAEQGRDAEAAAIAHDLDERLPSLPVNALVEDWGLAQHPRLRLSAVQARGGLLAEAELDARRSAYLHETEPRVTDSMRPYLWVHAYAEHADTPERARQAMAALERLGGIPAFRPVTATHYSIGRTLMLAGRAEQAASYLRKAAAACTPLDSPVRFVRASLLLGGVLAALGDEAGACIALSSVLRRWGAAKARSLSAEEARTASRALACPGNRVAP